MAEYYEGRLKLCHVDVDEYPELAARFRVRTVPTLALLRDGEVVERFVGGGRRGERSARRWIGHWRGKGA
ncbi:MAG: thioredoxin family protein [Candidatus Latescibacterota bacterium]